MPRPIKHYSADMAGGDVQKMRKLYREWYKVANERIKFLESGKWSGKSAAYRWQVQPLEGRGYVRKNKAGVTVFKGLGRNATDEQVREAFHQVVTFLSAKTSTAAGVKEVQARRESEIEKYMPDGVTLDSGQKNQLLAWLGSPEGKEALRQYDSGTVITAMAQAMSKHPGKTPYDLWQDFLRGSQSLADWMRENEGAPELTVPEGEEDGGGLQISSSGQVTVTFGRGRPRKFEPPENYEDDEEMDEGLSITPGEGEHLIITGGGSGTVKLGKGRPRKLSDRPKRSKRKKKK